MAGAPDMMDARPPERSREHGAQASFTDGSMLVVCHGPYRGRKTTFLPLLLDTLSERDPQLRKRILLHRTGNPLPSLDGIAAIMFMLGDPIERYPVCEADALAIARDGRARGIRLLNPPEALNNTIKSRQSAIWRDAGLRCASAWAAPEPKALEALLPQLPYPVILRFDNGHTQQSMAVCRTQERARQILPKMRYPVVALEFIDTRQSWIDRDPASIMAHYYHKKRSMVFPEVVINNHVFFSPRIVVGSATSTYKAAAEGYSTPRLDECLDADIAFSFGTPEQPALMQAALRALGLDFAAVDFSTMADGEIILWEANPYFDLPHWSEALLPDQRRLAERNPRYVDAMARQIARMVGLTDV